MAERNQQFQLCIQTQFKCPCRNLRYFYLINPLKKAESLINKDKNKSTFIIYEKAFIEDCSFAFKITNLFYNDTPMTYFTKYAAIKNEFISRNKFNNSGEMRTKK